MKSRPSSTVKQDIVENAHSFPNEKPACNSLPVYYSVFGTVK